MALDTIVLLPGSSNIADKEGDKAYQSDWILSAYRYHLITYRLIALALGNNTYIAEYAG